MHPVAVSPGTQEGSPFVGSEEHTVPPEAVGNVLKRAGAGLREVRTVQTMLAAMIAWSITVAPAAFARSSPLEARMVAVLALPCGLAAPPLALARRSLGRHLGISVFLALVTLSWLLASTAIQPQRLDPIRAGIGAVAWGVFALSWRDRWPSGAPPQPPEGDAPMLQARSRLPPVARAIVTIGAVAALALLFLAWRIREADRGLMAQIVAIACAIALSSAAADMSTGLGRRAHGPRRFTPHAVRPLLLLLAFAVAGAVIIALQ
ncbi:hypothetical protein [Chondromyces apiculatus]|uniref:hypothetical protein n=1 Tax=Chondromyces apiculatus TaxID=51 RepID=UPI000693EF09|nr:hypothetical protein [Chondromyces apiculatus]